MSAGAGKTWVGQPLNRAEDSRLLKGGGRFTDDVSVADQLYGGMVRSRHPHARIVSIDASAALAIPGVVAVVTGKEALERWNPLPPMTSMPTVRYPVAYPMAVDKVCYQGEAIAAVAAESRYLVEDAIAAVRVEYELLPALATVEQALGDESSGPAALVYEDWGDNLQFENKYSVGDVEAAFAEADLVVRRRVSSQRHSGVPLETRAVLAEYDGPRKQLKVRMSTQIPHQCRSLLGEIFDLREEDIQVISEDVGGAYGNKAQIDAEATISLLSIVTGRPVKWAENRSEWMMAGTGARDWVVDIEAAFRQDGELLAIRQQLTGDVGCDGGTRASGFPSLVVGATYVPGPYRVSNYSAWVRAVVTNKAAYGGYRGYGKDAANTSIERVMDKAARLLGIDPVEIRRRNLVDEYPYQMVSGPIIESGSLKPSLERLTEIMDLPALRERQLAARAEGRYLGIGLVSFLEPSGASIPGSYFNGYQSATVRMAPDGSVLVLTGIQNTGQGVETPVAQVAADRLGCHPDRVRVVFGDTDSVPYGLGSFSSRGATYGLSAVFKAATEVRGKIVKAAANRLEAGPEEIEIAEGFAYVRGSSDRRMSLDAVARAVYRSPGPYIVLPDEPNPTLEASCSWTSPEIRWVPDANGRLRLYPDHSGGAEGLVVEVDPATGQVRVERVWLVHDVGTQINPAIVEGQAIGSVVQGLGGLMLEQLKYDADGYMVAGTLTDYQMPNFLSVPPVSLDHFETPSPGTPLGTKGGGEPGLIGTGSALMCAIEDALSPFGVEVSDGPLTPAHVRALVDNASIKEQGAS